ncbi:MAG TPA: heavy metal-binding domain-containing protein [Ktedonobacterales bacterium]|jgi:uncharacterized protein YbjQ (UPF0145 family)
MPRQPRDQATDQGGGQGVPLDQQSAPVEMPESARARLKSMEDAGGKSRLFTSDLSTNEFLLVKQAGFDPVGMVVGSSIYHVGYQPVYASGFGLGMIPGYSYDDGELSVLSEAKYRARELAMARMEAEAQALGADGVVGVRLDAGEYEWGRDLVEFIAVGTAVRARQNGAAFRTRFGKPFTSDLSGQDLRTLLHTGYKPLGLVMGTCVYAAYQNGLDFQRMAGMNWAGFTLSVSSANAEISQFTDALYAARDLGMRRMQTEAAELGAEGIVGMQLTVERRLSKSDREFMSELRDQQHNGPPSQQWRMFRVDLVAIGTAIAPLEAAHPIATPQMIVGLES